MELFNYKNLLEIIGTVNVEKEKLSNEKQMLEKNKLAELENELLNSGIIEDWHGLNQVVRKLGFIRHFNRFNSEKLNSIYIEKGDFYNFSHTGNFYLSYYKRSYSYGISPKLTLEENKIVWVMSTDATPLSTKEKIEVIQTLFYIYESFRLYCLNEINEAINKKLQENEKVRREIASLL